MTQAPTPPATNSRDKLLGIEFIRGIAALLIVMHHAGNFLKQDRYGGQPIWGGLTGEFHLGVDFFFVLSGFIITWVHWNDLGKLDRLKYYAIKRFTRIYPTYWAVLIPLILLYSLFPNNGHPEKHEFSTALISFALIPNTREMVLGVAWTLTYEVFFYIIFGILLAIGRRGIALLFLWAAAIIGYSQYGRDSFPLSFALNPYNLEFLMGVAAALLLRRFNIPFALWFASAGLIIFAGCMFGGVALLLLDSSLATRILFGLSATMALVGLVEMERSGRLPISPRMQILGAMSYSLYLAHPAVESFTMMGLWNSMLRFASAETTFVVMTGIALVAGFVFHKTVELRLTRWTRHLFSI